jgi:hypothetical protein
MLLFIQVLAGFFLRQYRNGIEDYRYYESLHRKREGELTALKLYREIGNKEELIRLANRLLEDKDVLRLTQGETTIPIETLKTQAMNSVL